MPGEGLDRYCRLWQVWSWLAGIGCNESLIWFKLQSEYVLQGNCCGLVVFSFAHSKWVVFVAEAIMQVAWLMLDLMMMHDKHWAVLLFVHSAPCFCMVPHRMLEWHTWIIQELRLFTIDLRFIVWCRTLWQHHQTAPCLWGRCVASDVKRLTFGYFPACFAKHPSVLKFYCYTLVIFI